MFGILHFMGCMVLSPILKKVTTPYLFLLSIVLASTSSMIPHLKVSHNYFLPFGLVDYNTVLNFYPAMLDYYPLLPWSWNFVFGMALSRMIYREKKSLIPFSIPTGSINYIGRNSLLIYLIHVPILIGIMELISFIFKKLA